MAQVAAVFDVDGTLVTGRTEALFFWYLVRQGYLKVPQVLGFLGRLACRPRERFRDKTYLDGLAMADLVALARRCYREVIAPRVELQALSCIREHQARGHVIVLLTGSLAFLLAPLKEEVAADWLIATELARYQGRFTGRIDGLHPRGVNKLRLLLDLAGRQGLDPGPILCLRGPLPGTYLFRHIGHPVAVNPSWRLRRIARKHHWPIRYF